MYTCTFLVNINNTKHVIATSELALPSKLVYRATEIYRVTGEGTAYPIKTSIYTTYFGQLNANEVLLWHLASVPLDITIYEDNKHYYR